MKKDKGVDALIDAGRLFINVMNFFFLGMSMQRAWSGYPFQIRSQTKLWDPGFTLLSLMQQPEKKHCIIGIFLRQPFIIGPFFNSSNPFSSFIRKYGYKIHKHEKRNLHFNCIDRPFYL
jgi:hypothetical protein